MQQKKKKIAIKVERILRVVEGAESRNIYIPSIFQFIFAFLSAHLVLHHDADI